MGVLDSLYHIIWLQPVYNALIWCYTVIGQQHSGLTLVVIGLLASGICLPLMIRGFHDQRRTRQLAQDIAYIKTEVKDEHDQQQQILRLLKRKKIRFQSESVFLFVLTLFMILLYPVLLNYWPQLEPSLLYSQTPTPDQIDPTFGPLNMATSSPTLSLLPAILLFIELRQSYREQQFLTNPIDRWYPFILPLFVYFLIFWLPSGLSVVMSTILLVSLYVRFLLEAFAAKRHTNHA